ncbi:hypothetical protein F5Y15DRAFT_378998 [Xylariaceae sp. FL0016]|nr:hypothetical protein F5Y15DRAFT_378998 [Xylariaceae sp. FL0016]
MYYCKIFAIMALATGLPLTRAEPIPIEAKDKALDDRQAWNWCCTSGCRSCSIFGCVGLPCTHPVVSGSSLAHLSICSKFPCSYIYQ